VVSPSIAKRQSLLGFTPPPCTPPPLPADISIIPKLSPWQHTGAGTPAVRASATRPRPYARKQTVFPPPPPPGFGLPPPSFGLAHASFGLAHRTSGTTEGSEPEKPQPSTSSTTEGAGLGPSQPPATADAQAETEPQALLRSAGPVSTPIPYTASTSVAAAAAAATAGSEHVTAPAAADNGGTETGGDHALKPPQGEGPPDVAPAAAQGAFTQGVAGGATPARTPALALRVATLAAARRFEEPAATKKPRVSAAPPAWNTASLRKTFARPAPGVIAQCVAK
jgi:hypothetical protein